ncbi:DUF448 domain-containing protein [Helicobacter muridarum]|uniref:Nucleic acid binding transriptional terminator n=2 Tax=Helicobacter muridarum TaxID=216 RepID=A0A377PSI4_9HELI|nr:DUF448 domain-containing protein [Helicobacter muridarum]STQ85595.1 Nucleic acid binding transriptional terminator [Helicobacter muridarum]
MKKEKSVIVRFYSAKSIRMCITCKNRFLQSKLIRFKAGETKLSPYNGIGRSFYICNECLIKPKTVNHIKKYIKHNEDIKEQLKEITQIWQVSKK